MKQIIVKIDDLTFTSQPIPDNAVDSALGSVASRIIDDGCEVIEVPPLTMTTQPVDLSFSEVVYLEQALSEGIDRYKLVANEYPEGSSMRKRLVDTQSNWTEILAKTTLLYPDKPRKWS